jgi:hypothetical protein
MQKHQWIIPAGDTSQMLMIAATMHHDGLMAWITNHACIIFGIG